MTILLGAYTFTVGYRIGTGLNARFLRVGMPEAPTDPSGDEWKPYPTHLYRLEHFNKGDTGPFFTFPCCDHPAMPFDGYVLMNQSLQFQASKYVQSTVKHILPDNCVSSPFMTPSSAYYEQLTYNWYQCAVGTGPTASLTPIPGVVTMLEDRNAVAEALADYTNQPFDYSLPAPPDPGDAALQEALREEVDRHPERYPTLKPWLDTVLVDIVADRLGANNPASPILEDSYVRDKIARECLTRVRVTPGFTGADCGSPELPIFVGGSDHPQATAHIAKALDHHNPWLRLRYLDRGTNTGWYATRPQTDTSLGSQNCVGSGQSTACDEYPFWQTEQGGPTASPLPHLEIIDWRDNSLSGGSFGGFITKCALAARRVAAPQFGLGNFLVLPVGVPFVPTMGICNGPNPPA